MLMVVVHNSAHRASSAHNGHFLSQKFKTRKNLCLAHTLQAHQLISKHFLKLVQRLADSVWKKLDHRQLVAKC